MTQTLDVKAIFSEAEFQRLKALAGKPLRQGEQFNELASTDVIRHFAHGYGDTNPLFTDREYARRTRWGGIIAPPTFLFSCAGHITATIGFPGAHALWAEDRWTWNLPVHEGDVIKSEVFSLDCRRIYQKFADPMYAQEGKRVFKNQRGEVVAEEARTTFRFVRQTSDKKVEERNRYKGIEAWTYTEEDIAKIYAEYDQEVLRGSTSRYFEDVAVGEVIPQIVKGPLTVTDFVAWKIGLGFAPFTRAHKIRADFERRHPTTAIKNKYGIPDAPERVHWEEDLARENGIPLPFDFGHQRITWLAQVATNWMGDDGFLRNLKVRIRKPNMVTDTSWCRGKVVAKELEGDKGVVRCEVWSENQRGWVTATGEAVVVLPRRRT